MLVTGKPLVTSYLIPLLAGLPRRFSERKPTIFSEKSVMHPAIIEYVKFLPGSGQDMEIRSRCIFL
jgi:hypothetical protein